jgi:hypothetical protein
MRNRSSVRPLCADYQRLLTECQLALTNWNTGRAEIQHSGRRGKDADNELLTLQANFAKAWALLQYHERDCEVCKVISIVESVRCGSDGGMLQQLCH